MVDAKPCRSNTFPILAEQDRAWIDAATDAVRLTAATINIAPSIVRRPMEIRSNPGRSNHRPRSFFNHALAHAWTDELPACAGWGCVDQCQSVKGGT